MFLDDIVSPLNELSKDQLKNYIKANAADAVQRTSSDSFKSGAAGDRYNKSDFDTPVDRKRERGMDRALTKLAREDAFHSEEVGNSWSDGTGQWSSGDNQISSGNNPMGFGESETRLSAGDPIIVTAPNEFEGKTGEIAELSPSGKFVVVDLYNHGQHSMHLSDVEYNKYADQDDYEDLNEVAVNPQFINAQVTKILAGEARRMTNAPMAQLLAPVMKEYNLTLQQIDSMVPGGLRKAAGEYGIMMKEGYQDFNRVEPYEVCLAGKCVKKFDYYEQARRFHDNWKQKLYREGNKAKADTITLMPLNLDEMDKSQKGPAGWNIDDYDYSKGKWTQGKPVTAKNAVKDMGKELNKAFNSPEPKTKKPVKEAGDRVDPILIKALNRMPDGLASHGEVLNACYDAYAMELGRMEMKSNYGTTNAYIPQLMDLYKQKHGLTFNEAGNPAQQAAIAIAMKKAGKKPKQVDEFAPGPDRGDDEVPDQILKLANRWWNAGDKQPQITSVLRSLGWTISQVESEDDAVQMTHDDGTTYFISADDFDPEVFEDTGSWIVYDPETKQIRKRFKTHTAGKSYAKTHGLGFASSEYYFDNIKEQELTETALNPRDPKGDYAAKRKALQDLGMNKDVDQAAVLQRRLDLDREAKAKGVSEGGYNDYDNNRKGFGKRPREDDEYHVPDPVETKYNIKVNGQVINGEPFANRAEAVAWAKKAVAAGKLDAKTAMLSPINQVNELSTEKLAKYKKAAGANASAADKRGDVERGNKRFKGIVQATNKQFDNDMKKHQGVAEGFDDVGPVTGAITRRILSQRLDLLKQYGPELVGAAVDNVADYVGDVEEIGSSDVSGWVMQVERMLKENPPEAFAEAQTDYSKRRQRERDIDAGKPVARQPRNPQTDYARKRAKEKRDLEQFGEGLGVASNKDYQPMPSYKNYEIYVAKKPFGNTGKYIAYSQIGNKEIKDTTGTSREEAVQAIRDKIDFLLNAQKKVTGGSTIDFNVKFATDILHDPKQTFYAKLENIEGQPKLVIASDQILVEPEFIKELGFKKSSLRKRNEPDEEGRSTPLPGIPLTAKGLRAGDWIANGRYLIGNEHQDSYGNRVFDLTYHSTAHTKSDKLRIPKPAFTLGTNREVDEGAMKDVYADNQDAVYSALTRRVLGTPAGHFLIKTYGLDQVMDAMQEVADFHGDVEEIGSSDVSAYMRQLQRTLESNR